jgi:hypothetical protein
LSSVKITGTCLELEKHYLRLTETPNPATIRPESVLKNALDLVINKYKKGVEDHLYLLDQLRSIRQVF